VIQDGFRGLVVIQGVRILLHPIPMALIIMVHRIITIQVIIMDHIIILHIMGTWVGRITEDMAAGLMEEADIVVGTAAGLMAVAAGIAVGGITESKAFASEIKNWKWFNANSTNFLNNRASLCSRDLTVVYRRPIVLFLLRRVSWCR
jgi:hypothetical protein